MELTLHRPETLEEAVAIQRRTGGRYLSGGTVLMVDRRRGKDTGDYWISLDRIPGLRDIRCTDTSLTIGGCVTFRQIEDSPLLRGEARALWQAACQVGGPQVRNRGTVGGNLAGASPSADAAPPLLALDAIVTAFGAAGERRIPLADFFRGLSQTALAPDEIITGIDIPRRPDRRSAFLKVGRRNALAISCLSMAVAAEGGRWRVAVGAAAPTPVLCAETGAILTGGGIGALERACRTVVTEISPIDDRWGTADYRRAVCTNALRAMVGELEGEK